MMKPRLSQLAAIAATAGIAGCLLSACSWSVGGGKQASSSTSHPTRGQELIDLKRALDQGAISQSEYEAQKQRTLGH